MVRIGKDTIQLMKKVPNSGYADIKYYFLFHSNKIENSVLSERGMSQLLEKGEIDMGQENGILTMNDMNECLNSGKVFDQIVDTLGEPLNEKMLCRWHGILMSNSSVISTAGAFKQYSNKIYGSATEVASVNEVQGLMKEYIAKYNSYDHLDIEAIAILHAEFERIHPFQDGNGRIGRYIILKQCFEHDQNLICVKETFRNDYFKAIEMAQVSKNRAPLVDLFKKCCEQIELDMPELLKNVKEYAKICQEENRQ